MRKRKQIHLTKKIRLLLVEDNRLLLEGITSLIKKYDDIQMVAMLGKNEDILQRIRNFKPDILLLDLGLANQNSLQIVKTTKTNSPTTKIIVMDLIPIQSDVLEFVQAGVAGFILKDATIEDFLKTIRSVAQGTKVLPSLMAGSLFSQIVEHAVNVARVPPSTLRKSVRMTKREQQVITLLADGMTNKEIAQKLNLSPYTIKSHVHNILEKLALHTRIQIANYAHTTESLKEIADTVSLMNE
jgi:two-component system, NarL family, response regulator DegU